ncbi:GNAT family N-acetyltransferase [Nesterenkonia muleiensis]|uniref:GNAT family N-acetyltransferase n=1 Tax=Nesterenkonia muleiensis TaxID=2282648 RepID=UPI00192E65FF|nr:GNAT family N-acetyltransferase [Nesterenkonia muleiensis]
MTFPYKSPQEYPAGQGSLESVPGLGPDVRVCFVGDSFVAGTGDPTGLGWVGRVATQAIARGLRLTAYSLGVRRETSVQISRRLPTEIEPRLTNTEAPRVVVSFGVNDTVGELGRTRVEAHESVTALINIHQAIAPLPLLMVGPPAVDDDAQNARLEHLTGLLRATAEAHNIPFIDTFRATVADETWRKEVRNGDGYHPGANGYQLLAEIVVGPIVTWLRDDSQPPVSGDSKRPTSQSARLNLGLDGCTCDVPEDIGRADVELPILKPMVELRVMTEASPPEALAKSLTGMFAELVREGAALGWTVPPSFSEVAELVESLSASPVGEACAVIATVDHQVAGFGYWRRYQRPTHRPHADLEKMAIGRSFAGTGLGRRLLRELIEQALVAGIEQLTLDFRGDNHAAEHLYLSEGFKEYGRLPGFVAPAEAQRLDKVFHVLDLRESGG